ncbi:MAG: hypothetical protein AAFR04_03620 [Pseudomonadota bacterium]
MALASAASLAAYIVWERLISLLLVVLFGVAAFYFYPLTEKERPQLGAGEYGIFIGGLGIIDWRGVSDIHMRERAVRTIIVRELCVDLARPLDEALLRDWRLASIVRLLMRLPWRMEGDQRIIIKTEPLAEPGTKILARLIELRRYFGMTHWRRK